MYNFDGLTPAQQAILSFKGWAPGFPAAQPAQRDIDELIRRKLVIEHRQMESTFTPAGNRVISEVIRYEVPFDVHRAWCERCDVEDGS